MDTPIGEAMEAMRVPADVLRRFFKREHLYGEVFREHLDGDAGHYEIEFRNTNVCDDNNCKGQDCEFLYVTDGVVAEPPPRGSAQLQQRVIMSAFRCPCWHWPESTSGQREFKILNATWVIKAVRRRGDNRRIDFIHLALHFDNSLVAQVVRRVMTCNWLEYPEVEPPQVEPLPECLYGCDVEEHLERCRAIAERAYQAMQKRFFDSTWQAIQQAVNADGEDVFWFAHGHLSRIEWMISDLRNR